MHTLSFTLQQHTPLIHFQPHQDGATLRATEVKPKLDRYLIDMVFKNNFDEVKQFMNGYEKSKEGLIRTSFEKGYNALNYKLSITANPDDIEITPIDNDTRFPCFFGNMGVSDTESRKQFSLCRQPVLITIRSYHKTLLEVIEKEAPNFFARNNFGTRQTKGFGSFYIHSSDKLFELPGLYSYFVSEAMSTDFRKVFEDIELVHKVVRSGINDKGRGGRTLFYMKPLIWQYFRSKGIAWEKRKIKKEFYDNILHSQEGDYSEITDQDNWPLFYTGKSYKIIKDLMGLSSSENWRLPYNVEITKESGDIDRMNSPYFFKPILINNKFRIYIDFNFFNKGFLSAEFKISNGRSSFPLQTPDQFDIDDFFEWCLLKADINSLIGDEYSETAKAGKIISIFRQLRNNIII